MIGLIVSGVTAFPIETELKLIIEHVGFLPQFVQDWISEIYQAVKATNAAYPYLSYGTDWLAFAHEVIAIAFWGPLKDPVRNKWVVEFGMIACVAIFPLAFIAGPIRSIPFYWRLIDCSFGVFGMMLLVPCYRYIRMLERAES